MASAALTRHHLPAGVTRTKPIAMSCVLAAVLLLFSFASSIANAQPSLVGPSTSTSSTTEGARKSFFDTTSNNHWVFWYNGAAIEYASSPDGSSWTSQGTLAYNTPNYSVAFQAIGGRSYVFLVSEANTYDVVMRRGTITGTGITFESEVTVLDGSSVSDSYIRPQVAFDLNGKVWTSAFKDLGDVGDRYHLTARRTVSSGSQAISFSAASSMGKASTSVTSVAMVATAGDKMLAVVSGESGRNVVSYEFDGSAWSLVGSGGDIGQIAFASGYIEPLRSIAVDGAGNLYVGGLFPAIGRLATNNIAKWNGSSWSALGDGLNSYVYDLAVDASGNLYAGGSFTTAGGVPANYIAKWNGTSWSALGDGTNGSGVSALAVDSSGNLYIGGSFSTAGGVSANNIAKWNGTSWSALGDGTNGSSVSAIALDSSGNLFAGGAFTTAGGVAANNIAKWNGTSWSALGDGMGGSGVSALAIDSSDSVYAGGYFTTAGGVNVNHIAKWNGTSWSALGDGMNYGPINALAVDTDDNLYATGAFSTAGGVAAKRIAKWNGTSWSPLGSGVDSHTDIAFHPVSRRLYAAGDFVDAGGTPASRIAAWNGTSWSTSFGTEGFNKPVNAAITDANGNVYIGGDFTRAGGVNVNHMAKWNGTSWSPLGTGINDAVYALALDRGGNLYAGGAFTTAGGVAANSIAKWNGTSWSALGDGLNSTVVALAVDADDNVYVGGYFTTAGGMPVHAIAQWNGTSWSALGDGVSAYSGVSDLVVDASGNLYAAGTFTTAGGVAANRIAKWNGTSWSALGGGLNDSVNALAVDASGNLYAGGSFTTAGGVAVNRIAMWNGTSWSALGAGVNAAWCLTVDASGNLYAAGEPTEIGPGTYTNVVKWNGTSWSPYGKIDPSLATAYYWYYSIAALPSGGVFAGGVYVDLVYPVAATDQLPDSSASLVTGTAGDAHLVYLDENRDVLMKTYEGSSTSWSSPTAIHTGTVTAQASGIFGTTSNLATWFIENGIVKYTEASAPYTTWSAPNTLSSVGSPRGISVNESSGSHSQLAALWNRVGASSGEVVSMLSGPSPTPTPTATITPTPTSTATPSCTPTPTLPAPPPPDIDFGHPGDDTSTNPRVVIPGLPVSLSGAGPVGYSAQIQVDGIVVGVAPIIPPSSGGQTLGTWTFTLPPLAPGPRALSVTYIGEGGVQGEPSPPVTLVVVARAPLDFTGVGDTAITSWRRIGDTIRFKIRRASGTEWSTQTIRGHYPAAADYDDDGITDIAAVSAHKGAFEWNVKLSTTGKSVSTSLGEPGDTIIAGCKFAANKGASLAVVRRERRMLTFTSLGDSAARNVTLRDLGNSNTIGCGDTDGDGIDELLFTTRDSHSRVRLLGYNTSGAKIFESAYNKFLRGYMVQNPGSRVPLVAIIGGVEDRRRQVRVTTMAGSFAFPRFFVARDATVATGTFTTESNTQVSGVFWSNRSSGMVYRRLLGRGATTAELFTLPRGYSLLRSQTILRTGVKRR